MTERKPPLAQDLSSVEAGYTWKFGELGGGGVPPASEPAAPAPAGAEEIQRLQAQVKNLTAALEDVVAFALSNADYKERAIMMHRRAVAALSGVKVDLPRRDAERRTGSA